jgi:hypothetical protein
MLSNSLIINSLMNLPIFLLTTLTLSTYFTHKSNTPHTTIIIQTNSSLPLWFTCYKLVHTPSLFIKYELILMYPVMNTQINSLKLEICYSIKILKRTTNMPIPLPTTSTKITSPLWTIHHIRALYDISNHTCKNMIPNII